MRVGILKQDNGTIPASAWAVESAAQIVDVIKIEPNSLAFEALVREKKAFEQELAAALTPHHEHVQSHECECLQGENGHDRLCESVDPDMDHLEEAVADVQRIAQTKIFGDHFNKPEVIDFVRSTLGSHFATVKNIERSYHADRHPHTPQAQEFRARNG